MVSVASQVALRSERRFYSWMAFAMAAVTLIGFGPTYYFAGIHDGVTPILTPRLHVHGALSTTWILLLIAQTQLIAVGQRRLHRLFGFGGVALAVAVLVTGVTVALASERRVHTAANAGTLADPYVFLMFPMAAACLFAGFVVLGVVYRHRADSHKRLMLLATMNLIGPALARIVTQFVSGIGIAGVPGVVGALVLVDVFIAALAIYDYITRGRLHPVTLWGGGFIIVSEPLRFAVAHSAPWQAFAQMLMG